MAKLEIWQSPDGLTCLVLADMRGDDFRKLLEPESKVIHTFEAKSHYGAMTYYYKFMDFGEYTTDFAIDHEPFAEL